MSKKEQILHKFLIDARSELFGIEPEDLTTAERNIWRWSEHARRCLKDLEDRED